MPFQKGQTGNPNGRPLKNRALTAILEAAGDKKITGQDGKQVARKQVLAELLWQIAQSGKATFPDGTSLDVTPDDWFGIVQFLYKHIDGPPPQNVDVTSAGEQIQLPVVFLPQPATDDDSE